MLAQLKRHWFANTRSDLLSGITVALALIPEAIAFSIIAGVDPMVGLHASICIAVLISIFGGRPGMISAATGAMALVMVTLVKEHGLEYLLAATVLTGIIQYLLGVMKLGKLVTFIPQPVIIGFVNALAILIFMAQLVHFEGQSWIMYALVALTLVIIYVLPRFTKAIPSALAAIIIVSVISVALGLDVNTVGDMGKLSNMPPLFRLPDVIFSLETLWIILPYSISLAFVGIIESLLTATIVDEMTETSSDKNREIKGQGIANVVTGFFGGMAGCAMIGQSVINVKSGGRTRLSTFTAGVFLLLLIMALGGIVTRIPMAALVGVMFMVSIGTFDWSSLRSIRRVPAADAFIMIVTVAIVVATHNLAYGVFTGIVLSALVFAWRMARIRVIEAACADGTKHYTVSGQLFFATMTPFVGLFRYQDDPPHVVIDFTHSHLWDQSAAAALAKTLSKYEQLGKKVTLIGLNDESKRLIEKTDLAVTGGH